MTDPTPATVAVPVSFIRKVEMDLRYAGFVGMADQTKDLLPKPTPRLVVVDLDNLFTLESFGVPVVTLDAFKNQPDLLTLLDEAVDASVQVYLPRLSGSQEKLLKAEVVKRNIRAALGQSVDGHGDME